MTLLPRIRHSQNPLLLLAAALCLGIVTGHYVPSQSKWIIAGGISVALITLISIWLIYRHKLFGASGFIITAFLLTGLTLSQLANADPPTDRIKRMFDLGVLTSDSPVELTGVVNGQPEPAPDGFYLTVQAQRIAVNGTEMPASGSILLLAHTDEQQTRTEYQQLELHHGARIRVMTLLDRDEEFRNPGVMPFTEYLDRKDYDATGVIKSPLLIERLDHARVFLPAALIYEWRERIQTQIKLLFSVETAGILQAVLLGNRYNVSEAIADRFRAGGTFHFLVIAGLHITFIAGLIFLLLRRITPNRLVQFAGAVSFIGAYSFAVGAQLPVMRAALVFSLGVLAPLVWRRASSLNIIAGAALALLVWRPNDLFDPSFQLTFLSVISIVTIAVPIITRMQQVGSWRPTHATPYPPVCPGWFRSISESLFWSESAWKVEIANSNIRYRLFKNHWAIRFERWRVQRSLRFVAAAMIVTASVQLGMLPLLIIYFHRISFSSFVLNVLMGVVMAVFVFVALAAILIAQFSAPAAVPFVFLAERLEWLMVHLVDPFMRLGIAAMRLPHYHGWMEMIYIFYFLVLGVLASGLMRWSPLRPEIIGGHRGLGRHAVKLAGFVYASLLMIIVLHPFSAIRADGHLHVDFLDVGQGDSALITMPNGATLLIDGGGRPSIGRNNPDDADADDTFQRDKSSIGERVVSEYLWSRGLDSVDYILPTHADADHIDGLNDVARNFRVRGAIVARTPKDDAEYKRFAGTMNAVEVPIERVAAGDVLHFGDVTADVLWPPPSVDPGAPYRNNDGLVLRFRCSDRTFLFMADVEKETEAALVKTGIDLHADVVRVAHHGSRTSSNQQFVAATHASFAIISVGRTSMFGHPHKEVVDRWRASGAQVMTTGESGTISVVTDGKDLKISTFANEKNSSPSAVRRGIFIAPIAQ